MKLRKYIYILLASLLLTACSTSTGVFDEEKCIETAETAITLFIDGEYEKFKENSVEEVKTGFTDELLEQVDSEVIKPSGEFVEFTKHKITETKDKDKNPLAGVQVHTKFKEITRIFTVVLDENYKISGFFVK